MAERRYNDKEIAAIFRAAAEEGPQSPQREVARDEGLTLSELQAIGGEVGISSDAVAQAARAVDVRLGGASRTFLGLRIGVARTVNLNRRLTDEEWERLVVQLREVFNARGRTRSDGSLRQWTNGNLQVLLEPTETGHRLRFRTVHGGARASIGAGVAALGAAGTVAIVGALGGHVSDGMPGIALPLPAGGALIANRALGVPRGAEQRLHACWGCQGWGSSDRSLVGVPLGDLSLLPGCATHDRCRGHCWFHYRPRHRRCASSHGHSGSRYSFRRRTFACRSELG